MIKRNTSSYEEFWHKLIDYAGLFPPTELPLEQAIHNYAEYVKGDDSWRLGAFVHPAFTIEKLNPYISLFSSDNKLKISATGKKTVSYSEFVSEVIEDLIEMNTFNKRYAHQVTIEAYEVPLPPSLPTEEDLQKLSDVFTEKFPNIDVFLEVAYPFSNKWESLVSSTLQTIAAHNNKNEKKFAVKLRTGNVKAELVPSSAKVAHFIFNCQNFKIPAKFTAGLHHPLRMYREEIQDKMHGFLNVFTAGIMTYVHSISKDTILNILNEENKNAFAIEDNILKWNHLRATSEEISEKRETYLCSYGSCNFKGPIKELDELNIIKGVKQ